MGNVRVLPLNLDKIFEWGPLHDWWREDLRYTLSIWKYSHPTTANLALGMKTQGNLRQPSLKRLVKSKGFFWQKEVWVSDHT